MYFLLLLPLWISISLDGASSLTVNTTTHTHQQRLLIPKFRTTSLSTTLLRDKNTCCTTDTWRNILFLLAHNIDINSCPTNNRKDHPLSLATSPPYNKHPNITLLLLEHGASPTTCDEPTTQMTTLSTYAFLKGAQKIYSLLSPPACHNNRIQNYLTHQPFSAITQGSLAYLQSQHRIVECGPFLPSLRWSKFLYNNEYLSGVHSSIDASEKEFEDKKKNFYYRWHCTLRTSSFHTTLLNCQKNGSLGDIIIRTKQ